MDEYYFHKNPDKVPAPVVLSKAIPVTPEDFSSGELGGLVGDLQTQEGFTGLAGDAVRDLLARGFGYESWREMALGPSAKVANMDELPFMDCHLLDVIAWRMYLTGQVGLREALVAMRGAWDSNLLSLRKAYGDFRQLDQRNKAFDGAHRCMPIPCEEWRQWPSARMTSAGTLRMRWAAELAYEAATYCWTPDCGRSPDEVAKEILRGGEMKLATVIDQSWMFNDAWPTGLEPTQYLDQGGKLVGYGWRWKELGLHSANVFGSTEAFKRSAIALWHHQPTHDLAATSLPAQVVEVDFVNPWDSREFSRLQSQQMRNEIAFERRNRDQTPWMELHATDGKSLRLGRDLVIGGDAWTGAQSKGDIDIDGLLGLRLRSMDEVLADGGEIGWLEEKVPYALSRENYEALCRIANTLDALGTEELDWVDQSPTTEQELSKILTFSCHGATPGIAARSAYIMEEPLGTVKQFEVPSAGKAMGTVYPELATLAVESRGEYALGFYGKDGVRHRRRHMVRDPMFMIYAVLRNLGLDVRTSFELDYLAVFRLVRLHTNASTWQVAEQRKAVSDAVRRISGAQAWVRETVDDLDDSASGPSRLEEVMARG